MSRTRDAPPRLARPAAHAQPPASHRRKIYGAGHDQAILSLGINADLRSVFNWNVKQLFAYVTAEYETEANVLNQVSGSTAACLWRAWTSGAAWQALSSRGCSPQVIVWDAVISDPDHAWIRSDFVVNKYSLTDQVRTIPASPERALLHPCAANGRTVRTYVPTHLLLTYLLTYFRTHRNIHARNYSLTQTYYRTHLRT